MYVSEDESTVVIAVKGTTAAFLGGGGGTSTRDKINVSEAFHRFIPHGDPRINPWALSNQGGMISVIAIG